MIKSPISPSNTLVIVKFNMLKVYNLKFISGINISKNYKTNYHKNNKSFLNSNNSYRKNNLRFSLDKKVYNSSIKKYLMFKEVKWKYKQKRKCYKKASIIVGRIIIKNKLGPMRIKNKSKAYKNKSISIKINS